jgi:hypothetical protein
MTARRFPPLWSIEELAESFVEAADQADDHASDAGGRAAGRDKLAGANPAALH